MSPSLFVNNEIQIGRWSRSRPQEQSENESSDLPTLSFQHLRLKWSECLPLDIQMIRGGKHGYIFLREGPHSFLSGKPGCASEQSTSTFCSHKKVDEGFPLGSPVIEVNPLVRGIAPRFMALSVHMPFGVVTCPKGELRG